MVMSRARAEPGLPCGHVSGGEQSPVVGVVTSRVLAELGCPSGSVSGVSRVHWYVWSCLRRDQSPLVHVVMSLA